MDAASESERRVLALPPTARDAQATSSILGGAGIAVCHCADVAAVCREIASGAGAVLLTDESLKLEGSFAALSAALLRQPKWSDLPLVLLAAGGANSSIATQALQILPNVLVLDRPVQLPTLLSAVKTALRSRARQYEIRDHISERMRAEEALKEADRRKDEFLAMLGHELRNPLATVASGVKLLRSPDENEREKWIKDSVERQVQHLSRIIDDLLDVSRITRGKIQLRFEEIPCAEIAQRAAEAVSDLMMEKKHRFLRSPIDPRLAVRGDPARLQQVLVNLLTNAAKYTPEGGEISLSIQQQDGYAVIAVRDNGMGIPPEMHSRIFDLFGQVDSSLHRSQGGLGIGLSLVKMLVEMHGGNVTVASEGVGKGSLFTVRLPALHAPERGAFRPENLLGYDVEPGIRFLLVEDNPGAGKMLSMLLERAGHEVTWAKNGLEGVAQAERIRPDVVLLDIGLPGIDGYEVARKLRDDLGMEDTLIIAATGYGQEKDRVRSREAGIDHHLVKPVDYQMMAPLLASWRRARRRMAHSNPGRVTRPSRILVVDDVRALAMLTKHLLETQGHQVEIAYDGKTALEIARASDLDAVFCDINLPDMSGYEIATILHSLPKVPLLVAVSGYDDPETTRRCLEAGFQSCLTKPISLEAVARVLSQMPQHKL